MERRRIARFAVAGLIILLIGIAIWKWTEWRARAEVGAAYGARITCSCRYVEGRSAESCVGDTEPGMEIVAIADDPEAKAVTGSVAMMARRTARFRQGYGCLLDP